MAGKLPTAVSRYMAEIGRKGGRSKTLSPEERRANARRAALARWQRGPQPESGPLPIWELARKLAASIPEKELRRLPRDGARQVDHYLYGAPKRRP